MGGRCLRKHTRSTAGGSRFESGPALHRLKGRNPITVGSRKDGTAGSSAPGGTRSNSADGSAPDLGSGGRRFDSGLFHHPQRRHCGFSPLSKLQAAPVSSGSLIPQRGTHPGSIHAGKHGRATRNSSADGRCVPTTWWEGRRFKSGLFQFKKREAQ